MRHHGEVADAGHRRLNFPANESSSFYRMIVPSIIHDNKLKIPGKFTNKIGNDLRVVASLATPNGCVWQVGLQKIDNKFWFANGWREFVEHQCIRVGYLLIFTYEGNSCFRVNIFDIASSEIKYQYNTLSSSQGSNYSNRCPVPYMEEAEDDVFQTLASFENKGFPETQMAEHDKSKSASEGLKFGISRSTGRSTRDIGIQCNNSELMKSVYEIRVQSLSQVPLKPTKKRKRATGPRETEASAKKGSEESPGAETDWLSLRRSYVYKGIGLHMPSSFAEKYLGGVSGFITLQVSDGEKWPVKCMWRDGSAKLSKGWPEFVRDNKLEEGDVCVFELVKVEDIVLRVTIFRVVEDAGPVNQLPKEHLERTGQFVIDYNLNR
ncbi:hypothetical protein Vadar_000606 [Vaccinium darrowii]|uniref:Uncharacterized protein n=1 Tax=Vaccinium darrowii TaxID=229202 RepID=A0ACB7ZHI3_9ERIC|nr:hypothetical protein Vadar_000606 [Vaccinium darrowii]